MTLLWPIALPCCDVGTGGIDDCGGTGGSSWCGVAAVAMESDAVAACAVTSALQITDFVMWRLHSIEHGDYNILLLYVSLLTRPCHGTCAFCITADPSPNFSQRIVRLNDLRERQFDIPHEIAHYGWLSFLKVHIAQCESLTRSEP